MAFSVIDRPSAKHPMALLAVAFLLAVVTPAVSSDTIHGCGGFVEASPTLAKLRKPSDPKLDYSHITVELHTLDGFVKERVQCAPNGYYFLPVYDKGTFVLQIKGPDGWSWDPSQVTVVADQDGCNGGDDINFRYTGFTLSGKAVGAVGSESCERKGEGPSGVKLYLMAADNVESTHEVASVSTIAGGSFKFINLIPGKYKLEARHPKWRVDIKGPSEVTLGFGNVEVDDFFFIPGYNLEGSVVSQGNPVLGVHVYLYSDNVTEVLCQEGPGNPPWPEQALCHAVSNANGKFTFGSLPCGKYSLVPYYRGENTVFDVSPSSIDVAVRHGDVILGHPFQVTGFSVGGRVIDTRGIGVEGVQILVNGVEKSVTDAYGFYKLDQVTSTQYTIEAQKSHFKFTKLENFRVLPNMASLPEIVASHYELCGSIIVDSSTYHGRRQVALTHGPINVKPQMKWTDDQGHFCFEVPEGEYRLSPITSRLENRNGLMFSPPHLDIYVHGPILDALLAQAQVTVSGFVKCIDNCDFNISILLTPFNHGMMEINSSKMQITRLGNERNEFTFDKVLPGKYQLKIRHASLSEMYGLDDDWCWEKNVIERNVETSDITNIEFVQKGFFMTVHSTHSAVASILQPNGKVLPTQIKKGSQQICLELRGIHELRFVRPCVYFGAFPFQFTTEDPVPVQLIGEKYLLTGKLFIHLRDDTDKEELADNIVIVIWSKDGVFTDSNNRLRLASNSNESTGIAILEYDHWARMGDKLLLTPKDVRNWPQIKSNNAVIPPRQFLFYPRENYVEVKVDGCQPEIPSFIGRPGMYIEGSVIPILDGVNITVLAKSDSLDGSVKKGDVTATVLTEKDGSYIAGPLYDDVEYVVQAAKAGYDLKPLGNHSFACQKLSQIVVNIFPGEGAEDQLPSVLLSLSGDNGYRKNAIASCRGAYIFDNLFSGSFFLRPLLKEYSFTPASSSIELASGDIVEVQFAASRFSYSVLGTVTSLTGIPEEGISLEARSEQKGYHEETITDAEGKYRLRGLLPDTSYTVKVVLKEDTEGLSRIERASPGSVTVQVGTNDTTAVDFVVFDQASTTIITGYAEGAGLKVWQKYLTVHIVSAGDAQKIEQASPLPLSYFFEMQGLPKGKYSVHLVSGLSEKTHKFETNAVEVDLERHPQIDVGPLQFELEERQQKQDLTPAPVLPVIAGLLVILVFASMPRLKDGYQWAAGLGASTTAGAQPKKDVRKPTLRKRTY